MRKYAAVAKILFKAQMVYRFDVAMTALATVGRIVFAVIVWGAIFEGREAVGGFTLASMLSYYVIASVLNSLEMSSGVSGEVSGRIRDGSFSKFMVIPSNPLAHFAAQNVGACAYYTIFAALAAGLGMAAFQILPGLSTEPVAFLVAFAMISMGLVFMIAYHFFIGTLAFRFQDIEFFLHVQDAVLQFVTGAIVPLTLLPGGILAGLRFLPFTYVTYTPAMLLTGQASVREGALGLAVLAVWTVAMAALAQRTYQRYRIRYDGVGI